MFNIENLKSIAGRVVRVDKSGPESRFGKLIAIKDDHIVIYNEDEGMIYYKNDHIKSLSMNPRDFTDLNVDLNAKATILPEYIDAPDFTSVMKNMVYRWIQINREGPEKIEGVLIDASDKYITLVAKDEIVQVVPNHIRSVSFGYKKEENKEEENRSNKQQANNKDDHGENNDNQQG